VKRAEKGNGALTKVVVIAFRYCSAELAEVSKISLEKGKENHKKIVTVNKKRCHGFYIMQTQTADTLAHNIFFSSFISEMVVTFSLMKQ
jgi:hypothetical protein